MRSLRFNPVQPTSRRSSAARELRSGVLAGPIDRATRAVRVCGAQRTLLDRRAGSCREAGVRRVGRWLALLAVLVWAVACEPGTGGRRVTFDLSVTPAVVSRPISFRTSTGWDVTLREACVSVGPVYFYENPLLARGFRPVPRRGIPGRLYDALIPSAHAHPGVDHFNGGEVRGEWLEQVALDLLAGDSLELGSFEGIAGISRSVTIGVNPPAEGMRGAVECLRGHHAYVVGTAVRDDEVVDFEGGLDIEETGNRRRMQVATELVIDDGRRIELSIDPRVWLDQARFEQLAVNETGRAIIDAESQARAAWWLGIQSATAFGVRSEP